MTQLFPTLTAGSSAVFNSSGTNVLTLYGAYEEKIRKSSNLFDFPMPTMDSDKKIMMDLMGCTREITVSGTVTISDVSDLYKYANDIVGLKDNPDANKITLVFGNQGNTLGRVGYLYTSSVLNINRTTNATISVYILDASVTGLQAKPTGFDYSISMMECDGTISV